MLNLRLIERTGNLPTDSYDILDNGKVVGFTQLRHKPSKSSDLPLGFESHIYYEILPEFRGRSLAKEALRLLLQKARNLNLKEVVLTTENSNIASQKVIEANGGIFLEQKDSFRKYKIDL